MTEIAAVSVRAEAITSTAAQDVDGRPRAALPWGGLVTLASSVEGTDGKKEISQGVPNNVGMFVRRHLDARAPLV